jgi:hypothetical protein
MLVRKINQYFGNDGQRIEELVAFNLKTNQVPTAEEIKNLQPEEYQTAYLGIVIIPVGVSDATGQMIDVRPQELRFPIDAENLESAFANFEVSAEKAVSDIRKRSEEKMTQRDSGIVIPNAAESDAINKMKLFIPE